MKLLRNIKERKSTQQELDRVTITSTKKISYKISEDQVQKLILLEERGINYNQLQRILDKDV